VTHFVVLDSFLGSSYDDRPDSYEFPERYLRVFRPLFDGEPICAIIYEPRGDESRGRMSYVGMADIFEPPVATGHTTRRGERLWAVRYTQAAAEFRNPVGREVQGEPLEAVLRSRPRGRMRNVATLGHAVRPLATDDASRILALAGIQDEERLVLYPFVEDLREPEQAVRERTEMLLNLVRRDIHFRDDVLLNYDQRCAVSGFTMGPSGASRLRGLLDAAHIRPVGSDGPDAVSNGIALTPTLHRLFDAGFFTLRYHDGQVRVRVSPRLDDSMVSSPDGRFRMPLRDDLPLWLPKDFGRWPSADQLRFHERTIFLPS
jgi:putative restriction endonuclease